MNNAEIFIEERWNEDALYVWVREKIHTGKIVNYYMDGEFTMEQEVQVGNIQEELKPFIRMRQPFGKLILTALSEHFSKTGYQSKSESYQEGKIKAIEGHLEDMRKIVFHALKMNQ